MKNMSKKNIAILTVFLAILIIHFTENNGMAWGFEFGGKAGKLFLTLFRIVAVGGIIYWLWQTIKAKTHNAVVIAISLILSGAIGNIIDSVIYGVIFDSSRGKVATLFSDEPYGELFYGRVVDMLYFPMYEGESFTFFNAIFNGADSWITIGVILLFLYNKHAFPKEEKTEKVA